MILISYYTLQIVSYLLSQHDWQICIHTSHNHIWLMFLHIMGYLVYACMGKMWYSNIYDVSIIHGVIYLL